MVQYKHAALALLLSTTILASSNAFTSLNPSRIASSNNYTNNNNNVRNSRRYSAIPYDESSSQQQQQQQQQGGGVSANTPNNLLDALVPEYDDDDEEVTTLLAKKEERRAAREASRRKVIAKTNLRVTLPIVPMQLNGATTATATNGATTTIATTSTTTNEAAASEPSNIQKLQQLATLVAKGQEIAVTNSVGMSLRQVSRGRRLSELALDVDTLRFQSFLDELQGRRVVNDYDDDYGYDDDEIISNSDGSATTNGAVVGSITSNSNNNEGSTNTMIGSIQVLQNSALLMMQESFDGVVVSSVAMGGLAWEAGVRAGDVLTATSATMGNKLWAKSTLDGVRSAISSRKLMTPTMDFEFRRLAPSEVSTEGAIKSFELSLSRPIGINVEDTDDGYVTITGISDKATSLVSDNLRVGDRVISVESSLGGQMWQVYNTNGLTSAVTSRLPGQTVRIMFEREVVPMGEEEEEEEDKVASLGNEEVSLSSTNGSSNVIASSLSSSLPKSVLSDAVNGFRLAGKRAASSTMAAASSLEPTSTTTTTTAKSTSFQPLRQANAAGQQMLLSRSRDLLRTYIARSEATRDRAIPIKVADRVLEAVMEAAAPLDGRTMSLIMKAYNVCDNADKAISTFEEVFCLAGDGSEREVVSEFEGKLVADISALNVFTISALLGAHARRGDYESSLRVLAAMEGNGDFSINGKKSRSWSGQGDPLNMLPDTRCYNIALASAAKRGTKEGLRAAVEIFESMPNPSLDNPPLGKPAKNLVTFNTMIDAFANVGRFEDALDIFTALKNSGIRPDSISYTTLIKASIKSGKIDKALDLLDDMKWVGVKPDIVSYNNVIEALCNANRLYEAKDLVNEMESARVSPDSMTYGLLMKGLLKAKKPGPCLTLFESACSDERTTALTENVQLYTTAISAAAALGDHERALELVSRMNRAGVKPNKKTLTALMGACISSRKYVAAADIFAKIKNPDGYSISVGLEALCYAGKFDDAMALLSEQRSGQLLLTGKQVMTGYNNLIQSALESDKFNVAREAMSSLLSAGYIPSKITFRAMTDGLRLQSDMPLNALMKKKLAEPPEEKFKFLLFILDSLETRKLTVDSTFYASILILGAQAGGLQKRIASIITRSRNNSNQKEISLSGQESSDELPPEPVKWEDLLANYSEYKEELGSTIVFPSVRVSSKDFGRVLAAEQAVAFRGNTPRRR